MKVIEYPDMTWTAEAVCTFCHARLQLEISDVCFQSYSSKYYVICPVCKTNVYSEEVLPWYVQRYAKKEPVGWPPGKKPKATNDY